MDYFEFERKLMGGMIKICAYDATPETASPVLEEAYEEGLRLQKLFNFFDKDSELSRLNKNRQILASPELLEVIKTALIYCEKTRGEYDISLGKKILQRKSGKELIPIKCSYKDIQIKGDKVTLLHPDVLIDLGSIAKGYITDKIGNFLINKGVLSFFIDARGDMLSRGNHSETISVQHPRDKERTIHPFLLKNSAVATSGDYKQYDKDYSKSHILNQKELISVTVVANTLIEADVFASAVFLLRKEQREKLINLRPKFKVYTIDKDLNEKYYNGFSILQEEVIT